jgi:hypothetical protein
MDSDRPRRAVDLKLECLEVARGHDGFLRGKPDPALLIAAYRINGVVPVSLVGRLFLRAKLIREIPCSVDLGEQELRYDARFAVTERLVVLVLAAEENSGHGVQALYTALERPEQILLYSALDSVPTPRTLSDWAGQEWAAPAAPAVEVLLPGTSLTDLAGSDQYIAASAISVSSQARCDELWRLPFVAPDQRNDWTLVLRLRVT